MLSLDKEGLEGGCGVVVVVDRIDQLNMVREQLIYSSDFGGTGVVTLGTAITHTP